MQILYSYFVIVIVIYIVLSSMCSFCCSLSYHQSLMRNQEGIMIELQKKYIDFFLTACHPFHIIFGCFLFVLLLPFPSDVLAEWLLYECIDKVVFCVIVSWVNCRKYENLLQFNTSWFAFLRTWYYFRLCFLAKNGFEHKMSRLVIVLYLTLKVWSTVIIKIY